MILPRRQNSDYSTQQYELTETMVQEHWYTKTYFISKDNFLSGTSLHILQSWQQHKLNGHNPTVYKNVSRPGMDPLSTRCSDHIFYVPDNPRLGSPQG